MSRKHKMFNRQENNVFNLLSMLLKTTQINLQNWLSTLLSILFEKGPFNSMWSLSISLLVRLGKNILPKYNSYKQQPTNDTSNTWSYGRPRTTPNKSQNYSHSLVNTTPTLNTENKTMMKHQRKKATTMWRQFNMTQILIEDGTTYFNKVFIDFKGTMKLTNKVWCYLVFSHKCCKTKVTKFQHIFCIINLHEQRKLLKCTNSKGWIS